MKSKKKAEAAICSFGKLAFFQSTRSYSAPLMKRFTIRLLFFPKALLQKCLPNTQLIYFIAAYSHSTAAYSHSSFFFKGQQYQTSPKYSLVDYVSLKRDMEDEIFPMMGGDGPNGYAKNSNLQKESAAAATGSLVAAIFENLDIGNPLHSSISFTFRIADLGCSVGPNTFIQVKNIVDAVTQKYQHTAIQAPEFQVYFNDLVTNDFNYLFATLPRDRQYFASGVPGSFHGRLFPKASLNFVYSANALQWLSKVPQELCDPKSPAFNRNRILYGNAPPEVGHAYAVQYAKDIEIFFRARGQELAPGGLMVLLIPGRPDGKLPAENSVTPYFEPLESTLSDMVNEGLISEDKFDTFNLPIYCPSPNELRTIIQKNGCFDVLRLEIKPEGPTPVLTTQACRSMEKLLTKHFGEEIIEPLFDRYAAKIQGRPSDRGGMAVGFFVLLKRNHH